MVAIHQTVVNYKAEERTFTVEKPEPRDQSEPRQQ